jgi:hypothetical protein
VSKSFHIPRDNSPSLSPSFCVLINYSTSRASPLHIAVSTPSSRVACRPIAGGYILRPSLRGARVKWACMDRTPSHDAKMKSYHPDDQGLGWKAVLQSLHDSRCAYFFLYFSYVTHRILLYCESTGPGLGLSFVWH